MYEWVPTNSLPTSIGQAQNVSASFLDTPPHTEKAASDSWWRTCNKRRRFDMPRLHQFDHTQWTSCICKNIENPHFLFAHNFLLGFTKAQLS